MTALLMTLAFLTGCATLPSKTAICDGTAEMRKDHAAALIEDGGAVSRRTGARLLGGIKAGREK